MKKIKYSLIALLSTVLVFSCEDTKKEDNIDEGNFKISGVTEFPSNNVLFLQQIIGNNIKKIDSVNLKDKKEFEFKGKLPEIGFYRLELKGKGATIFVLDNSSIQLELTGNEELPMFKIKGSKLNDDFQAVSAIQSKFRKSVDSLNQEYIMAENMKDMKKLSSIETSYNAINNETQLAIKAAIRKNEKSIVSVFAASGLDPKNNVNFLDSLATDLSLISDNTIVRDFIKDIEKMKKTKIGGKAPEFTGDSPDGRKISISDFKGKYLLVDFWASWCVPCRRENPNVVRLYEKYKNKDFDILSVSLDEDGTKWKNAIMADGLKWNHVSDLKGWESEFAVLYSVEEIPQTYLLDKDGKILARNLRSEELEKKLSELLN